MSEFAPATPCWPPARGGRAAMRAGAALALHVLLLWALFAGLARVGVQRPVQEVWTALLAIAHPTATQRPRGPPSPAFASARTRPPARRPAAAPMPRHAARTEPQSITLPPASTASAALAAAAPASAPSAPMPLILDPEATRAAIRAVARGPLLSERVAAATGIAPAPGANERLARSVDNAHHGDCLHGDFTGGGGGLLSLPFLAVAAARGQCAK